MVVKFARRRRESAGTIRSREGCRGRRRKRVKQSRKWKKLRYNKEKGKKEGGRERGRGEEDGMQTRVSTRKPQLSNRRAENCRRAARCKGSPHTFFLRQWSQLEAAVSRFHTRFARRCVFSAIGPEKPVVIEHRLEQETSLATAQSFGAAVSPRRWQLHVNTESKTGSLPLSLSLFVHRVFLHLYVAHSFSLLAENATTRTGEF